MTTGMLRRATLAVVSFAFILLLRTSAPCQSATTQVGGAVMDEAGRVIRGARVSVSSDTTGIVTVVTTGETGQFLIANLAPGGYGLKVEATGFASHSRPGLELRVAQSLALDIVLRAAGPREAVSVSGVAEGRDVEQTEAGQVIEDRRIQNLPTENRQFIDYALLTPFVTRGRAVTGGAQGPLQEDVTKLSFAGMSEQHSNFFSLDGADHTINLSGFQHLTPSPEAVQEFRIVSNSFGAQYGHALGGVVNIVTKSGGNDFHGTAYLYVRDDALNARNLLSAPGSEAASQGQFGAAFGGPLKRNRTFFFGNYEGLRKKESPIYTRFLLDNVAAVNAVKSFYRLSPENLDVTRRAIYDQLFLRLDHQFTEASRAFVRYNFVDQRNENSPGAPGNLGAPSSFRDNPVRDQSLVASLFNTLSPNVYNEFLFQYSHRKFRYKSVSGEPNLEISNLLELGRNIGPADAYRERRFEFSDTLGHQRGRHYLEFGGDFSHIADEIEWPLAVNGLLVFSPDSFFGAPPFAGPTPLLFVFSIPTALAGRPVPPRGTNWRESLYPGDSFERAARIPYSHVTADLFVRDRWRASKNLTFDFGLRYFVETRGRFDIKEDLNNFDPRLGFAYAPGKKLVIRGGAGVYHSIMSWSNSIPGDDSYVGSGKTNLSLLLGPAAAELFKRPDSPGTSLSPIPIPQFTAPAAFAFVTTGSYPSGMPLLPNVFGHSERDFPNPYSMQWSLQADYAAASDWVVGASYVGVHALKMMTVRQVNSRVVGRLPNGKTLFAPLDPRFGIYHNEFPGNASTYHGGSLVVTKRFSRNFALNANYTFSKTIDLVNSGSNLSFKDAPDDQSNLRLSRGLSNQHVGRRFVLNFMAEAPRRTILRNFRVASVVMVESPRYFTIFTGFDANGDLENGPDRVGSIGRNTYRGDGFRGVDLRVSRAFSLSERVKAEFVAESFNLLNTVNVTDVNTVYGAPDFIGPIPTRFGDAAPSPNPSFGTPAQASNAREIQFALKVRW